MQGSIRRNVGDKDANFVSHKNKEKKLMSCGLKEKKDKKEEKKDFKG